MASQALDYRTPYHPPARLSLGDKLQRLAALSPKRLRALEILVDLALEDLAKCPDRPPERIYP